MHDVNAGGQKQDEYSLDESLHSTWTYKSYMHIEYKSLSTKLRLLPSSDLRESFDAMNDLIPS